MELYGTETCCPRGLRFCAGTGGSQHAGQEKKQFTVRVLVQMWRLVHSPAYARTTTVALLKHPTGIWQLKGSKKTNHALVALLKVAFGGWQLMSSTKKIMSFMLKHATGRWRLMGSTMKNHALVALLQRSKSSWAC